MFCYIFYYLFINIKSIMNNNNSQIKGLDIDENGKNKLDTCVNIMDILNFKYNNKFKNMNNVSVYNIYKKADELGFFNELYNSDIVIEKYFYVRYPRSNIHFLTLACFLELLKYGVTQVKLSFFENNFPYFSIFNTDGKEIYCKNSYDNSGYFKFVLKNK
jgi:hypothetical protein